jgi:hypothetical protein
MTARTFEPKQISIGNFVVTIETFDIAGENGIPAFTVKATCGGTVVQRSHTTGAVDGAHAEPSPTQVQDELDAVRLATAKAAVHHELRRVQFHAAT